jgi:hypothetical protein
MTCNFWIRHRLKRIKQLCFPTLGDARSGIRVSLNTGNRAIAKRLVAEKSAELLKEIEGVRSHVPSAFLKAV